MKQKISVLFILLFIMIVACACASADPSKPEYYINFPKNETTLTVPEEPKVFRLPASLTTIEDEAFEGTAVSVVELPESVTTVGEYAFANIETLRSINIPSNITQIEATAFRGSNRVTLTGAPKGYARQFAREQGLPFAPVASFYAQEQTLRITGSLSPQLKDNMLLQSGTTETQNQTPTGRYPGELNASKSEEIRAYHIQGRSPPMA